MHVKVDVIKTCNLTWQWAGDNALLDDVATTATMLLLVECRDKANRPVPVQRYLGPDWAVQQIVRDGAHAGSATAVRRDAGIHVVGSRLTLLSPEGRDVQARYLRHTVVRIDGKLTTLLAGHFPLESTGQQGHAKDALARAVANARHRRIYGGDINGAVGPLLDRYHMHGFGNDPMAMMWSKGFDGQRGQQQFSYADHKILVKRDARQS